MSSKDYPDSGGSTLEASNFVSDNSIQVVKFLKVTLGGFFLLVAGIWIEAMATIVAIHVWVLDNIAAFLSEVVSTTFGTGAEAQVAAWETAAASSLGTPFGIMVVLVIEALVLYLVIDGVRSSGVVP
jgi:hypothetical protein